MNQKASRRRPKGTQEASKATPIDLETTKRRPRGAKLDLLVFYSVFKRVYSSKWDPEGAPEASRAPKMSPNASQKRPEDVQERQRSVQEAPSSIYSCFIAFSSDQGHPAECGVEP